ncbi:MAG: hypothetical protein GY929_22890 [Actinomycetia bacterium]|nr:hypothetical protein [Actinomycetes bacterium]
MSQTSTGIDPQQLHDAELGADTLLERLAPAQSSLAPLASSLAPPEVGPAAADTMGSGARPLGARELAAGTIGASLGAVLVLTAITVALTGAWAAFTGSEFLFWSWSEPAVGPAIALIVLGVPVAVYAACTIWLCVLFLPLLTFRLARSLLDRG